MIFVAQPDIYLSFNSSQHFRNYRHSGSCINRKSVSIIVTYRKSMGSYIGVYRSCMRTSTDTNYVYSKIDRR